MKRPGTVTLGAIGAAAACIIAATAYGAWYSAVARTSAESATLQAEIANREAAGGRAANARRSLGALAEQEARVDAYYVSVTDIVPFLESLEGEGERLGTEVVVVSVGDTADSTGRIPLSLSIAGSFDAVMRTLGAIEYHPNDVRTASLTLDTPPGDAATGDWTANVTLSIGMRAPAPANP